MRSKWVIQYGFGVLLLLGLSCAENKTEEPLPEKTENSRSSEQKLFTIVALGDSLTEGYGVHKSEAFPALLEAKLLEENLSVKVINSGVSGSTSASGPERAQWVLRSQPDLVIVALGANDGLRGVKVAATKENLARTIESLLKYNAKKVEVVLAGMLLPTNYGEDYRSRFESMYQELVQEYKIGFVPFLLKDVGGVPEMNLPDRIHPNPKGHQKIAENVFPYVMERMK